MPLGGPNLVLSTEEPFNLLLLHLLNFSLFDLQDWHQLIRLTMAAESGFAANPVKVGNLQKIRRDILPGTGKVGGL
jgi:hypothetical protein